MTGPTADVHFSLEIVLELDFFSAAFLSALLTIILIDLVLAGDNALIIGLVARNLPKNTQNKVIFWGTFGAIAIRAAMAILVVYILAVPGFMLAGGIALVWIARKLLTPDGNSEADHLAKAPAATFAGAVRTIVIADAVMGVDNVLAIGGAAHGSVLLIVLGLAISVPIIVWGSQLVIKLVDRYPSVILLGGAVLGWTAYTMIVREPMLAAWFEAHAASKLLVATLIFSVSLGPWYSERLSERMKPLVVLLPALLVWMLAFEVAASVWKIQADYLLASDNGERLFEAVRWLGWLPLAAAFLWLREHFVLRSRRAQRA
jgi:YjbE family integral membrane protein